MIIHPISRIAVAAILITLLLQGLFVVALFSAPAGAVGAILALATFLWAHRYAKMEALGAGTLGRDEAYYATLADRIGVIQLGAVMLAMFSGMAIVYDLGASQVGTMISVSTVGGIYLIYLLFAKINPSEKDLFASLAGSAQPPPNS